MAFIVLGVFWASVVFAFFVLNAKTALIFIGLWVAGLLVANGIHLAPYFFLAYEALLAACLCIMLKMEWS
jgi:hypothetical protein